ncbi:MAG: CDP-alcohol phosphatidyltransferase family protein [Candidatus Omnitrophota bacterium]|nr:CDP-alcohol phosphatidyltransferase family protein [Candidatus Omnitrophota bacterium]
MGERSFAGNAKVGKPLLDRFEQALVKRCVSKIPPWLQTYHLTLLSLVWSGLILLCSRLATEDIHWLWGSSAVILCQYVTDLFDGAVGRYRNTGLVRWGYYMDHLLDFVFLGAVGGGYAWIVPEAYRLHVLLLMGCYATLMVSTFLAFNVTNEFQLAYFRIGPTEARIVLLAINALLILSEGFRQRLERASPAILAVSVAALAVVVYRTQRRLWTMDVPELPRKRGGAP